MNAIPVCSACKKSLPPHAPQGLCPECLLKAGLSSGIDIGPETQTASGRGRFVAPSPDEIARLFPQLEILGFIGQGGMGAVYRARQKALGRIVALKILPPDVGSDPAFTERFTREARALARMNHPGVVTLYEFGQADQLYFFLMEFVDGVSLRQLLEGERLSPREALAIVPQICDALQYAHDQGIVHRDIKPENILLDRQGHVKVADFGLAKLVGANSSAADFSLNPSLPPGHGGTPAAAGTPSSHSLSVGKVMGTPKYMAPEQVEHPQTVDHRADIYSLGVVFYQMLTGELPGKRIEPPSQKVRIDVRLDEVVLRALEREPEKRYQQASQVKTAVEGIAASGQLASAVEPVDPAPAGTRSSKTGRIATRPDRTSLAKKPLPFERAAWIAGAVFLLTFFVVAVITFLLPKSFVSTARIRVEKAGANEAIRGQPDDYVFLTSELEVLGSQLVLSNVIERLHLDERWGQLLNAGIVLPPTDALLLLKHQLDLRRWRNTSVFDIRVFSLNLEGREPAEIANAIAESYKQLRTTVRVEILDHAEPSTRPVRPNIPMNLTLGAALGMVLGMTAGGLTLLLAALKREPRGSDSGPAGSAPGASTDGAVQARSPTTPHRSSLAIIGAIWAGLFFLYYFLTFTPSGWAINRAIRNNLGEVMNGVIFAPLMLVGFSAPIGVTVLGWLALRQIRNARGGLRAFGLAMFDVLLFPLLIMDGWLVWLGRQTVVQVLMPDRTGGASWRWGSWAGLAMVLILTALDLLLVRWSW